MPGSEKTSGTGHPLSNPYNPRVILNHSGSTMTPEHLPTEQYEAQLAEKVVRLQAMMTPFSAPVPEVFRSPVSHYRMRGVPHLARRRRSLPHYF
jgi:tRNA (uracil-5-)-methyltransferase